MLLQLFFLTVKTDEQSNHAASLCESEASLNVLRSFVSDVSAKLRSKRSTRLCDERERSGY